MKRPSVMAIVFVGLLSTVAASQRHGLEDSVKNYKQAIPKSADAAHKPHFPEPNWDVRYESGSFKLKKGQWLKSAFVPAETANKAAPSATISVNQLRENPDQPVSILTIVPDQLRAVDLNPKAEKDSAVMQRMSRSGCHYAETLMPKDKASSGQQAFVVWAAAPGAFSRALSNASITGIPCDWSGQTAILKMRSCLWLTIANMRHSWRICVGSLGSDGRKSDMN